MKTDSLAGLEEVKWYIMRESHRARNSGSLKGLEQQMTYSQQERYLSPTTLRNLILTTIMRAWRKTSNSRKEYSPDDI